MRLWAEKRARKNIGTKWAGNSQSYEVGLLAEKDNRQGKNREMSSGWNLLFTWSRSPVSFRKQCLVCLGCAALSIVMTGCGGAPSFEDLANKVKAGDTLKECEDRFWSKLDTNFAKQVGDKTYLYEFSVYARSDSQSGARVPVWLCFVSDDGYWGTYKLRAVRSDEKDAHRPDTQQALDALFGADPEMSWQGRISQHGLPSDPNGKMTAFKAVLSKLKQFPDRFAPDSTRTAFNKELDELVEAFVDYPFDAKSSPALARSIVELFESKVERKYSGHQYNLIEECVQNIYSQSLDR